MLGRGQDSQVSGSRRRRCRWRVSTAGEGWVQAGSESPDGSRPGWLARWADTAVAALMTMT